MSVGHWRPEGTAPVLSPVLLSRLAALADRTDDPTLGLEPDDMEQLAPLMRRSADEWRLAVRERPDEDLIRLVRFFAVAEPRLRGWEAGARSPVIPLARELRRRGSYPDELTAWIRSVNDNRFLPYGSLTDLL